MNKNRKERIKQGAKVHNVLMILFGLIPLIVLALIIPTHATIVAVAKFAMIPILSVQYNDLYNKAGDVVASHNHYGLYIRSLKVPRKGAGNGTNGSSEQKQKLINYARLWKSSGVDQLAYNDYGATHPIERKGRIIYYTGQAWFIKFSLIAQIASPTITPVTSPPTVETLFPILTGLTCVAETGPDLITVTPNEIGAYPTGIMLELMASPPMSSGIFTQKKLRLIQAYDPTIAPAIDITADYEAKYGALINGFKIFFMARLIMPTGEASLWVKQSTVAIPKP